MIFERKPSPRPGSMREIRSFCWLPKKEDLVIGGDLRLVNSSYNPNRTYWLEPVVIVQYWSEFGYWRNVEIKRFCDTITLD